MVYNISSQSILRFMH